MLTSIMPRERVHVPIVLSFSSKVCKNMWPARKQTKASLQRQQYRRAQNDSRLLLYIGAGNLRFRQTSVRKYIVQSPRKNPGTDNISQRADQGKPPAPTTTSGRGGVQTNLLSLVRGGQPIISTAERPPRSAFCVALPDHGISFAHLRNRWSPQ